MAIDGRLNALLAEAGFSSPRDITALPGGGNNRLFVVDTEAQRLVLKAYFHDPEDPRDRLGTEYRFAQFAWAQGVRTIPRPRTGRWLRGNSSSEENQRRRLRRRASAFSKSVSASANSLSRASL